MIQVEGDGEPQLLQPVEVVLILVDILTQVYDIIGQYNPVDLHFGMKHAQ